MTTSRELVLIQRDGAGKLVQIGAADPSHPVFTRIWTFWISDRVLHMDGSSFRGKQTIGTATFGPNLVLTGTDRRWDLNKSYPHPKFAENGRVGRSL